MARGREEAYSVVKEAISRSLEKGKTALLKEGYEKGLKEGEEKGKIAEREVWETKHGQGKCVEPRTLIRVDEDVQTEPTTRETTDSSTQTTLTSTINAAMQTVPNDNPPRLLNDAGMSTEPPSTCETGIQANEIPTSLSTPPFRATTLLTMPSQPPSAPSTLPSTMTTPLTTTAATLSPAPKLPPAPQKRRHTLPSRPTALPQPLQPPGPRPELPVTTTTSFSTTATTLAATTPATTTWATSSTQTTATTSEIDYQVLNDVQRWTTALRTELRENEKTRSSEHVVRSTERTRPPQNPKRRSRSRTAPSSPPQLDPQTLVPPSVTATSPSSRLSTTAQPLALPPSGTRATAQERRSTHLGTPEQPRNASQPPNTPQTPRERAVSPPPVSHTPAASLTTLSTTADRPHAPSAPPFPPAHPCSPLLDPKRAISPPPVRFNWADDAASLPTAPSTQLRDISCLKTGCPQPFGTLRRRTGRRRAPLQAFSSRKFFHSAFPSYVSSQLFITRRHPAGIGPGRPIVTIPVGVAPVPAAPIPKLDWNQDPRLADLSRALWALGWTPPC
jgi:hypothetical protein